MDTQTSIWDYPPMVAVVSPAKDGPIWVRGLQRNQSERARALQSEQKDKWGLTSTATPKETATMHDDLLWKRQQLKEIFDLEIVAYAEFINDVIFDWLSRMPPETTETQSDIDFVNLVIAANALGIEIPEKRRGQNRVAALFASSINRLRTADLERRRVEKAQNDTQWAMSIADLGANCPPPANDDVMFAALSRRINQPHE